MEINGYQLSRDWFDFCFENPEKISPNHTAIYFFAIEHCNRLGWKEKFGFPTQMTMDAIGIKKHQTYIKYFNDLIIWGFIKLVQRSKNQYSANIISLKSATPKNGKALDKAFINHAAKQTETNRQSTGQSNSSIDKQLTINNKTINKEQDATREPIENPFEGKLKTTWDEWVQHRKEKKAKLTPSTAKKQLQFLGGRDPADAIAIINYSITNGYTGLFELKYTNNNGNWNNNKTSIRRADAIIETPKDYGSF